MCNFMIKRYLYNVVIESSHDDTQNIWCVMTADEALDVQLRMRKYEPTVSVRFHVESETDVFDSNGYMSYKGLCIHLEID